VLKKNAFIEINNLLATRPMREIKLDDIEEISARYRIDLREKFLDQLKELYERYLRKCFDDEVLTDNEVEELNYLRRILKLENYDVTELHEKIGGKIYKNKYDEAICKGTLEKSKKEFLEKLQQNLRLPEKLANKISSESRDHFMDIQLGKIMEDGRVSPTEWEELRTIASNLNVEIKIDDASKSNLERMKLYWLIGCSLVSLRYEFYMIFVTPVTIE
jgi:Chloroplast envelope transporter